MGILSHTIKITAVKIRSSIVSTSPKISINCTEELAESPQDISFLLKGRLKYIFSQFYYVCSGIT
jgi:hypothetical protein